MGIWAGMIRVGAAMVDTRLESGLNLIYPDALVVHLFIFWESICPNSHQS